MFFDISLCSKKGKVCKFEISVVCPSLLGE